MDSNFNNFRESQHLIPINIENKERYYLDLINIEHSWTGRLDAQLANTFILESNQLLINAIVLFEKGYFDCAFYSLRQSLEISTTMTYLVDNDEESRKIELEKWKTQSSFPMYGQMIKFLQEKRPVFSEIKGKMADYFEELEKVKKKLNKYVHKQGFKTFYISRNHPLNWREDNSKFTSEFEEYLKKCIGAVAVFRLTIDPFPILLSDENIYLRTGDLLTRGYDDNFIETYIGLNHIENYKKTDLYIGHLEFFLQEEAKEPHTADVVKNQYIDKLQIDNILKQKHLLSMHDLAAVVLARVSEKIAKIYCIGGIHMYFTSTKSKRESWSWSSDDFKSFKESESKYNQRYDEAFISYIEIHEEEYYVEHNEKFFGEEILKLEEVKNLTYDS
ncbi:hypothetical protein [Niabella beijingensis]|uniref:hypothetical protein n=1 Tax=Niabella beijingensis TaxID=2872700 RepID=UPI001CBACEA1|nr:hypothetical protein [Niabella beijingensis]MBZ4190569.1 hypothetical protein [Niabella beijingensis]